MKITISDIEEPLTIEVSEPFTEDLDARPMGSITGTLQLERHGREVEIRGNVSLSVNLNCSRCLVDFRQLVSSDFDLLYLPSESLSREPSHEIHRDEGNIGFYSNDQIDISRLLNEQIILNIPMKPLCRDDCKGICPVCGKNMNEEPCTCRQETGDTRFRILNTLRKEH